VKGVYYLAISLTADAVIKIGALGRINFKKGKYVYVGSAMNSLENRIKRHARKEKKKHWHIDYFLANKNAKLEKAYYRETKRKIECNIAEKISKNGKAVKGFGSSDCNCESHFFKVEKFPRLQGFKQFRVKG